MNSFNLDKTQSRPDGRGLAIGVRSATALQNMKKEEYAMSTIYIEKLL